MGTKAIAVSRFRKKLSQANWVQGVTAISRKISRSWAPKKWGPTCDRDIFNSAIYREHTVVSYCFDAVRSIKCIAIISFSSLAPTFIENIIFLHSITHIYLLAQDLTDQSALVHKSWLSATKPLPKPILIKFYDAIWHHQATRNQKPKWRL